MNLPRSFHGFCSLCGWPMAECICPPAPSRFRRGIDAWQKWRERRAIDHHRRWLHAEHVSYTWPVERAELARRAHAALLAEPLP